MLPLKLLFLTFFVFNSSWVQADALCPSSLESLPIQAGGRVKPLITHAKQVIKFISGKSKHGGMSATELYCHLSLSSFEPQTLDQDPFQIFVEHVKTQEFLKLKDGQTGIDPKVAFQKLGDLQSYRDVLESRGEKGSFLDNLKNVVGRIELYGAIVTGQDWKIPIPLKSKETTENSSIKWIPIVGVKEIFPDAPHTKETTLRLIEKTTERYVELKGDSHLTEVSYEKLNAFRWAMVAVLLSLASLALTKKLFHPANGLTLLLVLGLETAGMIYRVLISGRAPVTNMYETVMWVGFGALVFAVVLAWIRKEKLFVYAGLALNLGCLFMMNFADGMLSPEISPLVPVLRDNFWLSTHVTMITISYAAFALSWVLANIYMVKSLVKSVDSAETKRLMTLCYDGLKIGVVLLAGGIILGGVWADYSWGRFWGWDPKETWALIALMAYIAILHGRYAGWIPPRVFLPSVALAFLTVIMAWFGVNYILATGLHSYGFSTGGAIFIGSFVAAQLLVFIVFFVRERLGNRQMPQG